MVSYSTPRTLWEITPTSEVDGWRASLSVGAKGVVRVLVAEAAETPRPYDSPEPFDWAAAIDRAREKDVPDAWLALDDLAAKARDIFALFGK